MEKKSRPSWRILCNNWNPMENSIFAQTIDPFQCPISPAVSTSFAIFSCCFVFPFFSSSRRLPQAVLLIDDEWHFNEPKGKGVQYIASYKEEKEFFFHFAIVFLLSFVALLFFFFVFLSKGARKQLGEISLWDFSLFISSLGV